MDSNNNNCVDQFIESIAFFFKKDLDVFRIHSNTLSSADPNTTIQITKQELLTDYIDRIKKSFEPRMTVPLVLSLFSIIDIIGYLEGNHKCPLKTKKNFTSFFKVKPNEISNEQISALNILFRQGIVHSYFPKGNLGVSYHPLNPQNSLFFKKYGFIILNVNYLVDIVEEVLDESKLKAKNNKGMNKRYLRLMKMYDENIKKYLPHVKG